MECRLSVCLRVAFCNILAHFDTVSHICTLKLSAIRLKTAAVQMATYPAQDYCGRQRIQLKTAAVQTATYPATRRCDISGQLGTDDRFLALDGNSSSSRLQRTTTFSSTR